MNKNELFSLVSHIWGLFSTINLEEVNEKLLKEQVFGLQWLLCDLVGPKKILFGLDPKAGYGLASEMFGTPINRLSVDDERDAIGELAGCIGGHVKNELPNSIGLSDPQRMKAFEVVKLLDFSQVLIDVMAKAKNRRVYVALLECEDIKQ